MLIYRSKSQEHYTVNYKDDGKFFLSTIPNEFFYFDKEVNFIYGHIIAFRIKNNKLMFRFFGKEFYLSEKDGNFSHSENIKDALEIKLTKSDVPFLTCGGSSYIYNNFLDDDKENYCRVSYNDYYGRISDYIKDKMSDYCLIPTIEKDEYGIIIEKVKIANTHHKYVKYINKETLGVAFKHLIEAVVHMNKHGIVHGDISLDNTVELDGKIMMIDIDGMFNVKDYLSEKLMFTGYIFTVPSFISKIVIDYYSVDEVEVFNDILNLSYLDRSSKYNEVKEIFKDLVQTNYDIVGEYSYEEALQFLNIYQTLNTLFVLLCMFEIIGKKDIYDPKQIDFFKTCLNVKEKRLISSDEFLELYKITFID